MRMSLMTVLGGGLKRPYLIFNGTSTYVNFGSAASLDDIPTAGAFTIDGWTYFENVASKYLISKADVNVATAGFAVIYSAGAAFSFTIKGVTTNAVAAITTSTPAAGVWFHYALYFDGTTNWIAINGTWASSYSTKTNISGGIPSDASYSLFLGKRGEGWTNYHTGKHGWLRISTGNQLGYNTNFTPPARKTTPAIDANTILLAPLNEGTGTAADDISVNNNNGTITGGTWGQD